MNLFMYPLRAVAQAIITPPLSVILIIVSMTLYIKNNKTITMQKIILGGSVNSSIELTLSQIVLGIIGGTLGSILLTGLGVVFKDISDIIFLFLTSILLMFIRPRMICFSYSGAILGMLSIIIKAVSFYITQLSDLKIFDIDILYLMTFIGVFHIIEGVLVMIDGHRGAIPVFTNKHGKILGGYAFKRYWPLSVAVITSGIINNFSLKHLSISMEMPYWWPIIKAQEFNIITNTMLSILPMYAILGYSTVTFTRTKREKAASSGIHIVAYGISLIIVAQLARVGLLGEIAVLIFAPFAHEFMLNIQRKNEEKRCVKFVSDEEGLVVLEIAVDSPIRDFGIDIGSKILLVNNTNINSEAEIYPILRKNLNRGILTIKDSNGFVKEFEYKHENNKRLGIALVPRNVNEKDMSSDDSESFKNILKILKDKEECKFKRK